MGLAGCAMACVVSPTCEVMLISCTGSGVACVTAAWKWQAVSCGAWAAPQTLGDGVVLEFCRRCRCANWSKWCCQVVHVLIPSVL